MVGATKKAQAQDFVLLFPVNLTLSEELNKLDSLSPLGKTIRSDATNKVFFKVVSSNTTIELYFQTYDQSGKLTSCDCPSFKLYYKKTGWFTDDSPADNKAFDKSETAHQKNIIDKAIKILKPFPEEIKKAEWLKNVKEKKIVLIPEG